MQEFYEFVRSAWVVWLMAVFIGIIVWVLWPSRRRKYSDAANIPLHDDDEPKNRRDANEGS
jgi:cbb3-type cytochrome oxidase subunit 3